MTPLEQLRQRVLQKAREATHVELVPVTARHGDQVAWEGVVEVFDIEGHPLARRGNGWQHENDGGKRVSVVVLGVPPIRSPQDTVRAATVAEIRKRIDRTNG